MRTLLKRKANQFDTINYMRELSIIHANNPFFKNFIKKNNLKADKESIKKIFDYIFNNTTFIKDNDKVQQIRVGTKLLRDKKGNCVDYSVLLSQFLINLGIPHSFKMVATDANKPNNFNHIYVVLYNDLPLDLVIGQDQNGFEKFKKSRKNYIFKEIPHYHDYKLKVI